MSHTFTNPAALHDPKPFGYSHTARIPAGRELVFVSGQYGSDAQGAPVSADFGAQVERAFANLEAALAAQGLELGHVVQLRTYVVDHDFDKLGTVVAAVSSRWPDQPPTQTILGVASLATPDLKFEVEAVAAG